MKKLILAAAAFAALAATPAFAQPSGHRAPPPSAYDHRGPSYDHRRAQPPRAVQKRQRAARVCVTSRGNCPTQGFTVPGQNCRCFIRGFGQKRGTAR
jgi:hypothetical protein